MTPTMNFEFHQPKAAKNLHKHSVSFEEAVTVFGDPLASTLPDPEHSDDEQRLINRGHVLQTTPAPHRLD